MRKLLILAIFLFCLSPLCAQPPEPAPGWKITDGNPTTIEAPPDWSGSLECADFSPSSELMAVGGVSWGHDGQVRRGAVLLFDARTGEPAGELRAHDDVVQRVRFSPDGKMLASQSQDGAFLLWDVQTRKLRHQVSQGHSKPDLKNAMRQPRLMLGAWSPDGKTIAAYESKIDMSVKPAEWSWTLKLIDSQSGTIARTFKRHSGILNRMAWCGDGKSLIVDAQILRVGELVESAVEIINAQNGEVVRRVLKNKDENQIVIAFDAAARRAMTTTLQMSPDKKNIVGEVVQLWDLDNDKVIWKQQVAPRSVRRVAFAPDEKTFYAGNDDSEIVLRDAATGAALKTLPVGGGNGASALVLSPDGTRLVKLEEASDSIQLWKLDEVVPAPRYPSRIVLQSIGDVRAFDWIGERLRVVSAIADSDYKTALRTGRAIQIDTWNAISGKTETQSIPETKLVSAGALSPDGEMLAVELGTQPQPAFFKTEGIGIYNLRAGKKLFVLPEEYGVESIKWSPDGKTVATGTGGAPIKLWDSATGELRLELQTEGGASAWSADGKLLAVGSDKGEIQIFEAASGAEKRHWSTPGVARQLAFSPTGETLAVGGNANNGGEFSPSFIRLFDVATGQPKRAFETQNYLYEMRWTPDGSGVAASSWTDPSNAANSQLRVWDAATGEERVAIDDRSTISSFAFSPDEKQIAAYNWMRVRVWDLK